MRDRLAPEVARLPRRHAVREPLWQVPPVLAQWLRTAMAALWRSAAPDRIDHRLRSVGVPVTVVRGTLDRLCTHGWAARLAGAAPRAARGGARRGAQDRAHAPDAVAAAVRELYPPAAAAL